MVANYSSSYVGGLYTGKPFPGSLLFDYSDDPEEWNAEVVQELQDANLEPDNLVRAVCKGTESSSKTLVHFADKESLKSVGHVVRNNRGQVLNSNLHQPAPSWVRQITSMLRGRK
ncbi:MAG: hypothetical protein GY804_09535 [Alphaproteobacteria bacterium]|nr:hypothetical protein [Alphaproteobacteria bacterium]